MKFNYDTYRPKKLIQDIWRDNNNYFYSKDVEVTPLTKIGDAAKVHQEQKAGKLPALARKLKPSQLSTKMLRLWRSTTDRRHTTKIKVHMAGETAFAHEDEGRAALISTLRGYANRLPSILQIRKMTLPLATVLVLVLAVGTIGGLRLISESHDTPQADVRKTNGSNQDDQHAAENSSTKKSSTDEANKDKDTPPTTAPNQQSQGRGVMDTTTNNGSYKNNYTSDPKDSSDTSAMPDRSVTPPAPEASTNTTSTPPPAPVAPQPAPDPNKPPSETNPTDTTPEPAPDTTAPETSDPSVAPTTGPPLSAQSILTQDTSSTSP